MEKFKHRLLLLMTLTIIMTMLLGLTCSVHAVSPTSTDSLGGSGATDPLRVDVYNNGSLGLYFWQPVSEGSSTYGYINQYFGGTAWGSNLFITDGSAANQFSTEYYRYAPAAPGVTKYDVGNGTQVKAGNSVTTTWPLYSGALQFKQTITYIPGNLYFEKKFEITNLSDHAFSNIKLFHGGDTYFGGNDSARSYWNSQTRMVYVKNENVTDFGLMGFYGSNATPADHFFAGRYSTGYNYAANGALPDTADVNYVDAGYQLEWDKSSLAAAESWTITSFEQITEPSMVQILAPAEQTVAPGGQANYEFIVQNFTDAAATFNLSAISENGWNVSVQEGNSVEIAGDGGTKVVHVTVTTPVASITGDDDLIALIATKSDDPLTTAEGGTRTIVDDTIPSIISVVPGETEIYVNDTSLNVIVNTNNIAVGTEVTVTLLDADKNPLVPNIFGTGLVTAPVLPGNLNRFPGFSGIASTVNIPADKSITNWGSTVPSDSDEGGIHVMATNPGQAEINLTLPGNLNIGIYHLSVTIPGIQGAHNSTTIEALAAPAETTTAATTTPAATTIQQDLPQTGEQAPWQPIAFGLTLLVLAGGAALIRFRIRHSDSSK